ncbi:HbrB [Rhodotorula toruloides ATCC 204091]|uniref:HbrB-like-domain containing protein n=2 Tax=Rhodotorula toruloides TaxID=5286 RepID=A0A2T0A872_RHOTO|nr:HbrB [Rhodotorula toruloides ATCC 204091]KAK4336435.1 HbrB-like-domain containing protein [Rhodotorula toruloides]PRQ74218.1 HbrB-like-domain containing protein [Rhodotorula toruloides]
MASYATHANGGAFISEPGSPRRTSTTQRRASAEQVREVGRKRSSSVTDGVQRTNSRIAQGIAASLAPTRRRSSGLGEQAGSSAGVGRLSFSGLGRAASVRPGQRTPTLPSSTSPVVPVFRTLESYSAKNVAAAFEPVVDTRQVDDVWQQVCVRVLPLFNGEGMRGYVEELNELVLTHVQRTFARCQTSRVRLQGQLPSVNLSSLVTGLLVADLTDLIRTGLTTLANKLSPLAPALPLNDDRLLSRLNEIWLFFFTGILPHLEAVFWVLRSDDRLRAAVGETWEERERQGRTGHAEGRIDVRRIALIEFRDQIIHPEIGRLLHLFKSLYRVPPGHPDVERSRQGSQEPSASPTPPDIRRTRSQPPPQNGAQSPAFVPPPSPHPQRQHSSPSRLSPDPKFLTSFPSPSNTLLSPTVSQFSPSTFASPPTPSDPFTGSASAPISSEIGPAAATQALARRRQMIAVLSSLLTADDRQQEMDSLMRAIRPEFNSRYSRRRSSIDSEDIARAASRAGGDGRARAASEGYGTPVIVGPMDDAGRSVPESGANTGMTGSPVMLTDEPSSFSDDTHLLPPPIPAAVPLAPLAPTAASSHHNLLSTTERKITARQRSRTMDSLDEEPPHIDHSQHPMPHPLPAAVTSRASLDVAPSAEAEKQQQAKKQRRRSFRPWLGRSNSANSYGSGASSTLDEDVVADDSSSSRPGSGHGSVSLGGDKLRRGLLRRNSSKKAVELSAVPQLGVASGFAVEGDVLE